MNRALLVLLLALSAACNVNPYNLAGNDGDGGRDGNGGNGDGGGDGDGGIDAPTDAPADTNCVPTPEVCDQLDNDCDGTPDDGFNLNADPNNCGQCGMRCQYPNAFGVCNNGNCEEGACQPGWNDTMPGTPGCDYFCIPTNGGVEVCDNRDNDCDTRMDETFNLATDVNNCGSCGNACNLLHATETCVAGMCEVGMCDPGFHDIDPGVPGCEYQCMPTGGGVETCDGVDNDCDGMVDDGNPGGGQTCGTDTGECTAGMQQCSNGVLFCVGSTGGTPEVCDNQDDDCDGVVDDGFDKMNDPQHCGSCNPCNLPFAVEGCSMGMCTIASCDFGRYDEDGNPANGCEYQCIPTGAEACDMADNDCDGNIDEGINITTDPNNCGMCGRVCSFANAGATCSGGNCQIGACNPNFYNIDGNAANGCEYGCILSNGGVEACDQLDNDCDGTVNDGNPGSGQTCGTDTGACSTGQTQCVGGNLTCPNDVEPVAESCNNVDDDCNNVIDNGFDKMNDVRYCNNCAGCNLNNAVAGCSMGSCTVAGCLAGWVNLDGQAANGCEYMCTASGQEVCDGRDNDCDGLTDQADPSILVPGNFCDQQGECLGTTPSCAGLAGWDCNYEANDSDVETQGNGDPVAEETLCDGLDNDCDGGADEVYPLKNTACAEDGTFGTTRKLGICRGTGSLICNATQNGLRCNVTMMGAAPTNEACNNRDDDCDGKLDEPYDFGTFTGVRDVLVGPIMIGANNVRMYRYEASRPDATAGTAGFVETRACSADTPTRLPWASGDFNEVRTACERAGMRLCRVTRNAGGQVITDEWGRFCEGSTNRTFPYGNTFQPNTCNGSQYDPVGGGVNEDFAIPSGSLAGCLSADGSNDQSGNLKEWVDDPRTVGMSTVHTLRGGAYDNFEHGMTCDFDLTVVPLNYTFSHTGFRCCSSCAPGQSECGGSCVNWATSNAHCGACGNACGAGTSCSNGYCCPNGTRACGDVCVPMAMPCP